jgi:hypothetical protein
MSKNFRYVVVNTPSGVGYICLYVQWQLNAAGVLETKSSASFCSPKDGNKFVKHLARHIAEERFRKDNVVSVDFNKEAGTHFITNSEFHSMLPVILSFQKSVPSWALRAVARKQYRLSLRTTGSNSSSPLNRVPPIVQDNVA